jgi:hypothetical protein
MRISIARVAVGLPLGLGVGLAVTVEPAGGLAAGLAAWLLAGLAFGRAFWPGDLAGVTSPGAMLARDRQAALLFLLGGGLAVGLPVGLVAGLGSGHGIGKVALEVTALGFGLGCLLALNMAQTAWPSYMLTRGRLAFHHHLPWSLMSFLADAHQRGVLRQVGAVYQFRHIELQHRLANRDTDKEEANSSAAPAAADDAIG